MICQRKTLVTGATGLVGNNVVRLLLERGEAVRVLQRTSSDPRPLENLDVEVARGDVCDPQSLHAACVGIERVVHAAGHVHIGWSGADKHHAINVEGTRNVVAAASQAGARLVHVSSVDTLGYGTKQQPADEETEPVNTSIPYPASKLAAERIVTQAVEEQRVEAVIVNPVYMFGPWDWRPSSGQMILEVVRNNGVFPPRGSNDFCDVRDVASGILAALDRGQPGRRYILGGECLTYIEAFRLIARITGGFSAICRVDPVTQWIAGFVGDVYGKIRGREPSVNTAAIALSRQPHHFNYARAASELGYSPRPASEAIRAAYEWFLEHGYIPPSKRRPLSAKSE
ncbi:MAG: NAD-dependent epimerase/dehydratase family protein [Planctomycetaceae bacterium]|nr:NAD-dependent epimerase/dehydratase family protein [Planctomycetaceae bacterium]